MSTRSLRARLDRLTRANSAILQEKDRVPDFTVDPALAKALQDDKKRLYQLGEARPYRWPPTNEDETEEERMLRARIAEKARTISCPAGYGFNEVLDDQVRLQALLSGEKLPPWFAHLTQNHVKDPDAMEAQLMARIEAFHQSPEGRARSRISELESARPRLHSAEYSELEGLLTFYPEPWIHPNDPMKRSVEAWAAAARKEGDVMRKRMQERRTQDQISRRRPSD